MESLPRSTNPLPPPLGLGLLVTALVVLVGSALAHALDWGIGAYYAIGLAGAVIGGGAFTRQVLKDAGLRPKSAEGRDFSAEQH
jgi:hypothetical protein